MTIPASRPPWSHLIRFQSASSDTILFGDAILDNDSTDIGAASPLKAKLIKGDPLSADCVVTEEIVEVKRLLGPLTRKMVPR